MLDLAASWTLADTARRCTAPVAGARVGIDAAATLAEPSRRDGLRPGAGEPADAILTVRDLCSSYA